MSGRTFEDTVSAAMAPSCQIGAQTLSKSKVTGDSASDAVSSPGPSFVTLPAALTLGTAAV